MKKKLKMKKYRSGEMVDDDDPEAQKVFRSDLTEYSDEERMPRGAKSVARKAAQTGAARDSAIKARDDSDDSYDRVEASRSPRSSGSLVNQIPVGGFSESQGRHPTRSSFEEGANTAARYFPGAGAGIKTGAKFAVGKAGELSSKVANRFRRAGKNIEGPMGVTDDIGMGYTAGAVARTRPAATSSAQLRGARKAAEKEDEVRDYLKGKSFGDRNMGHRTGGSIKREVKRYSSGGSVSASRRGDGIASRGKTRGKII